MLENRSLICLSAPVGEAFCSLKKIHVLPVTWVGKLIYAIPHLKNLPSYISLRNLNWTLDYKAV